MELPKEGRRGTSVPSHTHQKERVRARNQTKGFPKKSGKLEERQALQMVRRSVSILHSKDVVNLSRKDLVAKRDTTYVAFVMGRTRWQTTKSIDSPAKKHRANASFPRVQILCLTTRMPLSFTSPFCRITMCKLTIIVPVSLIPLNNTNITLARVHALSRALMQKTHSSLSFVPALHVSQPASSNWDYRHRSVSTTSNRKMLVVSSLLTSQLKLVGTFAGLGLNPQIVWACLQLLHVGLVAELEEYPLSSQMVFSLLAPSLCERTTNPMVFPKCPTSTACVCHMPIPSLHHRSRGILP